MRWDRLAALVGGTLVFGAGLGVGLGAALGVAASGGISPEHAARLEHLVRQDCGACHGMRLKGGLGPAIDGDALAGRDPADIARVILDGVPGTPMPPWRPLMTEEEARWIAEYLLSAE